jgi:hypothetical protein
MACHWLQHRKGSYSDVFSHWKTRVGMLWRYFGCTPRPMRPIRFLRSKRGSPTRFKPLLDTHLNFAPCQIPKQAIVNHPKIKPALSDALPSAKIPIPVRPFYFHQRMCHIYRIAPLRTPFFAFCSELCVHLTFCCWNDDCVIII